MKNPTSHFIALAMLFCFSIETRGQHIDSVLSLAGTRENVILPSSQSLSSQQITISIWLSSPKSSTNGEEVILSKKKYASLADFSDLAHWEVYDATDESGTNDVKGFVGAAFDGRYIYCSPWWKEGTQSGRILRYDTKQPYSNGDSWLVYDAESEDGHNDIRGLEGAVFDGTYVYFVPLHRDGRYYATVLRYDTRGEFSDSDSWEVFDAQTVDSEGTMKGFVGAVFDGTNIYFVPNPFSPHSRILRFNTKKSFNDTEAWSIFNLALLPNYNPNNGFFGGVFDGRYVYLVPYNQLGTVVRLDTQKDFLSPQAWSTVDFNFLLSGRVHGTFTGAVFDGQYVYFSPAFGGDVVRFDTRKDFSTSSSWEIASILNLDGEFDAHGGVGPTYDGRYVYFPPMHGKEGRSGKFIIYDTQKDFKDNTSWNYVDLSIIDPALRGFEGAVFDGEFVYFLPMNFDQPHGKITRYKSHAQLAFELTYNSSSSSFGSTPGKISFKVGTDAGVRSIFFKGDHQQLTDQYWHHIAVTYDGNSLKLYFDGSLNAFEEFDHYSLKRQMTQISSLEIQRNH